MSLRHEKLLRFLQSCLYLPDKERVEQAWQEN